MAKTARVMRPRNKRPVRIIFSSDLSRAGDHYDKAMEVVTKERAKKADAYIDFIPVTNGTAAKVEVGDYVISANQAVDQNVYVYEPAKISKIKSIGHETYLIVTYAKDTNKRILPWKTFKRLAAAAGHKGLVRFEDSMLNPDIANDVIIGWRDARRLA